MERFKENIDSITDYNELKKELMSAIELGIHADLYDGTEEEIEDYVEKENHIRQAMYKMIKNKPNTKDKD
jgi:hypothetical protein